MKSKVKYAVLVLVIGLLGLAILASPIFGKGKTTYMYKITVEIDGDPVTTFTAPGNKEGTRIVGELEYQQGMLTIEMDFPNLPGDESFGDYCRDEAEGSNEYLPGRRLYWSPLEDDCVKIDSMYCNQCSLTPQLQDLNSVNWKYHSGRIDYRKNTLSFRFDLFYIYYDEDKRGAHDHYILGIEMESWEDGVSKDATLNWTHYTEPTKPRGKNLQVDFQQFKCTCSRKVTITIEPLQ